MRRFYCFLRITFVGILGLPLLACVQGSAAAANRDTRNQVRKSARHDFRIITVVPDLEFPWCIAWLPSGDMLVTERPGRLRIVRQGKLIPEPIGGLPRVYKDTGQGGFMDVLPHPAFVSNQLLYLSYAKPNADGSQGATTVVCGRLQGNRVTNVEA